MLAGSASRNHGAASNSTVRIINRVARGAYHRSLPLHRFRIGPLQIRRARSNTALRSRQPKGVRERRRGAVKELGQGFAEGHNGVSRIAQLGRSIDCLVPPEVQSLSKGKHLGRPMSMTTFVATDGAAYELFMGRWTDWLAEPFLAFARIDPETASGAHLLDVGCGTGRLTFAAAARAPQ